MNKKMEKIKGEFISETKKRPIKIKCKQVSSNLQSSKTNS